MLTARGLEIAYGTQDVLQGVDWALPPASRWGLVGPNGSGKTTLLKALCGLETPDRGAVDCPGGSTVAYLPQEGATVQEGTLLEVILSPFTEIASMEMEIHRLQRAMADGAGDTDSLARQLGELQHRFEAAGGYGLETEAKTVLTGLGFGAGDHDREIREFSGGFRTRALLGSLLLQRPDYLLLDEPTNHLDLEGITWLESYLPSLPSAIVVVSHDRLFLNRIVGAIAEVERGKLRIYKGDYDHYRKEKEDQRERALAAAAREERRTTEVQRFIERFRYKNTKARQVQDRIRMLEKRDRTEVPPEEILWGFRFPPVPRLPRKVLDLSGVGKAFGEQVVLQDLDLLLERGDRVALVGPNGCGKSTLLKIVAGMLAPDGGDMAIGPGVRTQYTAQHALESFSPGRTALEELEAVAPSRKQSELRSLLGMLQFSGDEVFKKVRTLSGGEKNRLALARLVLDPGNFLLLDEPTNHLDLFAREALENALLEYEGSVLFASHDRWFISRVAGKVAGFVDGTLLVVEGSYDDFHEKLQSIRGEGASPEDAAARPGEGAARRPSRREERRAAAENRNARNRALRDLRKEVSDLEAVVARSEARLEEVRSALADPDVYRDGARAGSLGREEKELARRLADLMRRWEEASARLSEGEAEFPEP